ncbi:MoaD/ThiS family protein [Trueperella sp. LYQ143]|uniref:MoaD/ThiS family protein n=1 Tax=unclassified Trueperella TaxID=2630174 RepID=UPI0039838100
MKIQLRYFAAVAAAAEREVETIEFPTAVRVSELMAEIMRRHPSERMAHVLDISSFLVDGSYAEREAELSGEVVNVDILPPFAGGDPDAVILPQVAKRHRIASQGVGARG